MRKNQLLVLGFLLLQVQVFAQIQATRIDSLLTVLNSRELALASLAITQNGKLVYQNAIGFSYLDNDNRKPVSTPETKYKIGSVSKMFTATMIFQLLEEGKITLDQKLNAFFPVLPNAENITISQLLTHQSGLHDYTKDTDFERWMGQPRTQAELLDLIRQKGSDFQPGERNEYCNTNYLLLSYIIEKITGKTYPLNLEARITSKIKLKNTLLTENIKHPFVSTSYKYSNGHWQTVTETHPLIHSGAGALISTPADLTAFINALFTGRLVGKESLARMITLSNGFGSGIFPYDHGVIKGYGHNGRIEEFYTAVRYFPESKIALAYCTNGINYPRIDILESIVKICFNEPVKIPFTAIKKLNYGQYAGTYEAPQMPVVTISAQHDKLIAETQGARFELEPVAEHYFMHAPAGYYFEFNPAGNSLQIKETDNVYFLKKK